jgi:PilZ domain
MMDERRRHTRASRLLEIRWEDLSGKYNARVTDISLDGCYIESIGQVTVGQQIRFEIQLPPTGSWVPIRGEVVNHQQNLGFGVRFIGLSEQEQMALAQML